MDEISLLQVSAEFGRRPFDEIISKLDEAFPDTFPRTHLDDYNQGFQAGAIEVIRRLKEATTQ
jgi:hypothetical protein